MINVNHSELSSDRQSSSSLLPNEPSFESKTPATSTIGSSISSNAFRVPDYSSSEVLINARPPFPPLSSVSQYLLPLKFPRGSISPQESCGSAPSYGNSTFSHLQSSTQQNRLMLSPLKNILTPFSIQADLNSIDNIQIAKSFSSKQSSSQEFSQPLSSVPGTSAFTAVRCGPSHLIQFYEPSSQALETPLLSSINPSIARVNGGLSITKSYSSSLDRTSRPLAYTTAPNFSILAASDSRTSENLSPLVTSFPETELKNELAGVLKTETPKKSKSATVLTAAEHKQPVKTKNVTSAKPTFSKLEAALKSVLALKSVSSPQPKDRRGSRRRAHQVSPSEAAILERLWRCGASTITASYFLQVSVRAIQERFKVFKEKFGPQPQPRLPQVSEKTKTKIRSSGSQLKRTHSDITTPIVTEDFKKQKSNFDSGMDAKPLVNHVPYTSQASLNIPDNISSPILSSSPSTSILPFVETQLPYYQLSYPPSQPLFLHTVPLAHTSVQYDETAFLPPCVRDDPEVVAFGGESRPVTSLTSTTPAGYSASVSSLGTFSDASLASQASCMDTGFYEIDGDKHSRPKFISSGFGQSTKSANTVVESRASPFHTRGRPYRDFSTVDAFLFCVALFHLKELAKKGAVVGNQLTNTKTIDSLEQIPNLPTKSDQNMKLLPVDPRHAVNAQVENLELDIFDSNPKLYPPPRILIAHLKELYGEKLTRGQIDARKAAIRPLLRKYLEDPAQNPPVRLPLPLSSTSGGTLRIFDIYANQLSPTPSSTPVSFHGHHPSLLSQGHSPGQAMLAHSFQHLQISQTSNDTLFTAERNRLSPHLHAFLPTHSSSRPRTSLQCFQLPLNLTSSLDSQPPRQLPLRDEHQLDSNFISPSPVTNSLSNIPFYPSNNLGMQPYLQCYPVPSPPSYQNNSSPPSYQNNSSPPSYQNNSSPPRYQNNSCTHVQQFTHPSQSSLNIPYLNDSSPMLASQSTACAHVSANKPNFTHAQNRRNLNTEPVSGDINVNHSHYSDSYFSPTLPPPQGLCRYTASSFSELPVPNSTSILAQSRNNSVLPRSSFFKSHNTLQYSNQHLPPSFPPSLPLPPPPPSSTPVSDFLESSPHSPMDSTNLSLSKTVSDVGSLSTSQVSNSYSDILLQQREGKHDNSRIFSDVSTTMHHQALFKPDSTLFNEDYPGIILDNDLIEASKSSPSFTSLALPFGKSSSSTLLDDFDSEYQHSSLRQYGTRPFSELTFETISQLE